MFSLFIYILVIVYKTNYKKYALLISLKYIYIYIYIYIIFYYQMLNFHYSFEWFGHVVPKYFQVLTIHKILLL